MKDSSPILALPYLQAAQAQKHVTHNEALQRLDMLVQMRVAGFDAQTPPDLPQEGELHALGGAPVGAWAGQGGRIAAFLDDGWNFLDPLPGWRAWGIAEEELRLFDGSAWRRVGAHDDLDGLGVNATADAVNRLSVSAQATLLSHEGADHRLKVNKAAPGDTASLLFQSGWSGHAEMGLAGDTDFSIKVSPDGATWTEALRLDAESGLAGGAAVQESPVDATPGRLMRADYGYSRANAVGPVAQSGGLPAGAVIERGSNADGEYVRWADGTQICWFVKPGSDVLTGTSGGLHWAQEHCVFPAAFAAPPFVSPNALDVSPGLYWGSVSGVPAADSFTFQAVGTVSGGSYRLSYMAIGRWF